MFAGRTGGSGVRVSRFGFELEKNSVFSPRKSFSPTVVEMSCFSGSSVFFLQTEIEHSHSETAVFPSYRKDWGEGGGGSSTHCPFLKTFFLESFFIYFLFVLLLHRLSRYRRLPECIWTKRQLGPESSQSAQLVLPSGASGSRQ